MEPLISIQLFSRPPVYFPGSEMVCDYQIDAVERDQILSVEASILWYTEGKGDEDLGVHYFERRVASDSPEEDLRALRRFTTLLPNSPLTYHGDIVQVYWCARVRVFLHRGKEVAAEHPFQLGDITTPWSPHKSRS
ncbi:MAG: hypothetical protein O3C60_05105 [Planctomycetota bacterium]|nr:hypothetical protein [Planctomycetota bacterium]